MIVLYDIPSKQPGISWNPNILKARLTLNYKRIPYRTEWVECPDIESKCKEIGIPSTRTKPDGSPMYTLPAIWDPATKTGVAESYLIAKYLDKTYPDTPPVLFDGIEEYDDVINGSPEMPELKPLVRFIVAAVPFLLNPVSSEYYIRTKEAFLGIKWTDMMPKGQEKEEAWRSIKKGFDIIADSLQKKGKLLGHAEQLSYLDVVLGARVHGLGFIWGKDSELWRDMLTWNNGLWGKYVEETGRYYAGSSLGVI
ncbi:hypothetical protein M378DRAFT_127830 [Amanita muscaria Koide BX008]|uniref:GST N-terminal domain-containing protein n=1 Tax=Amanita muscaria (strain Koide BX008) TaxID=946122 RepID=A0A0C2T9M8_AMAMK|nr:hypothetical protein M378DRAFT_127830 [Amanita muscaria Koide BX008]